MLRPPLLLLMRLERDLDTPAKLKFALVQRREIETLVRKAKNDEMGPRGQAAAATSDC
jgi:hypothetical protein